MTPTVVHALRDLSMGLARLEAPLLVGWWRRGRVELHPHL